METEFQANYLPNEIREDKEADMLVEENPQNDQDKDEEKNDPISQLKIPGVADEALSRSLRLYYDAIFPFELLEQWLRYGNDPNSKRADVDKTFFARREFSFTLDNDAYLRYQFCLDWKELREKVLKFRPQKIDIGAVYYASPKSSNFGFNDDDGNLMQTPVEREFVIDIDMDEYNDIRTCCQDTNICKKCWKFMSEGAFVIDKALREDFGFNHIIWLFSGRRGVHAWVCDRRAREMSNVARSSVADYLRVVTGNEKSDIKVDKLTHPVHPHLKMSYEYLRKRFLEVIVRDQDLFSDPRHVDEVLGLFRQKFNPDENALKKLKRIIERSQQSGDFLKQLEEEVENFIAIKERAEKKQKKKGDYVMEEIVLYYMYPRIDINVSKGMNHLLKSPFCVHPKSKKVSVPIIDFQEFDPDTVPTINQLITTREDGNLMVDKTPILPYIDYFRQFILELEKTTKQQQLSDRKENRKENEKVLDF